MKTLAEASLRNHRKQVEEGEGGVQRRGQSEKDEGTNDKKRLKRFKTSSVPHSSSAVVLELPQAKNILSLKVLTAPCRLPPPSSSPSPLSLMSPLPSFLRCSESPPSPSQRNEPHPPPPASCLRLTQAGKSGERVRAHAFLGRKSSGKKT